MADNQSHFSLYGKSPLYQLIISMVVILFFGMTLMAVMIFGGGLFFGLDLLSVSGNVLTEIGEKNLNFLRYLMIAQDISLFIIPAIVIRNLMRQDRRHNLSDFGAPRITEIALLVILAFCIIPITGFTGQLNSEMNLPDWMIGIEEWMKEKEADAGNVTNLLINSDTFGVMIFNVVMISVLPAISEELIFRGVLQKIFYGFFSSGQPAIWITAFLFSALHLQFYGFIPRFILGLVFGYLFFWSGTLWFPVIAHFLNNAVSVVASYIQGGESITALPDTSLWKQLLILPIPVMISVLILLYFRNKSKKDLEIVQSQSNLTNT